MSIIKLKRSQTAAASPTGLAHGEVAVNITDKKIFIGNSAGATVLLVDGNATGGTTSTETIQDAAASLFTTGTHTGISVSYPDTNNAINLVNTGVLSIGGSTGVISAATGRTSLGLVIGTDVQGYNATLATVAAGTYTGTNTITTLGTITTGTWSASTITVSKGGTGTTTGNITGTGALTFTAGGSDTNINLVPLGTGTVDVGTKRITGLASPTNNTDAANKNYVDSLSSGINWHQAVTALSDVQSASTYVAGTTGYDGGTGVGAYIEANANGALTAVDSVSVVVGNRLLMTGRTNTIENGIYTVTSIGSAGTKWRITRATDMDGHDAASTVIAGDAVYVTSGTDHGNLGWIETGTGTGTGGAHIIGTDGIVWTQFTGTASFVAGDGLSVSGKTLSVNVDGTTLEINTDTLRIKPSSLTTLGIVTSGTWTATAIADSYISSATTWNTAYTDRNKWDGGATGLTASTGRTSLGLDIGTNVQAYNSTLAAVAGGTYTGTNTITTLGTIGTGTWSATAIDATKGGTGQTTYATGDLIYSSASDTLSKLTKPATTTSFLQMTSAGVPSWQTTIPATAGGTGSTAAFTSGALVYASSTSVLTTGTVFGITSSAYVNVVKIISGALPKSDQYFTVTENLLGSAASLGLATDADGATPATASSAYLNLSSQLANSSIYMLNATTGNDCTITAGGSGECFSITVGANELFGGAFGVVKVVDDPWSPYVLFGDDGTLTGWDECSIKMEAVPAILTIKSTGVQIITTVPVAGKVLTCTDDYGTVSWEPKGTPDYVLFNLGII